MVSRSEGVFIIDLIGSHHQLLLSDGEEWKKNEKLDNGEYQRQNGRRKKKEEEEQEEEDQEEREVEKKKKKKKKKKIRRKNKNKNKRFKNDTMLKV